MDCTKVGNLILSLRKEKSLTQKQLANAMHISDKTISKWERGFGCPDVSLLPQLSKVLGVNIEKILLGDLSPNEKEVGNMKRIQFYHCPTCGNIMTSLGGADISCCGRKLEALTPRIPNEEHHINVEILEDEYYITFDHPMAKDHYLNFIAAVSFNSVVLVRLYPEQGGEVRLPYLSRCKFYYGCNKEGLWLYEKKK